MSADKKGGGASPTKPALLNIAQPNLVDLITIVAEKADPIVKLLTATIKGYQDGKEREVQFQTRMSWIAVLVVVFIVGVAAWLTNRGKIDGSTFTFLLGLIVGYVLTFVRDQIRPE